MAPRSARRVRASRRPRELDAAARTRRVRHRRADVDDDPRDLDARVQLRRLGPAAEARQHRHQLRSDPEVARELRQLARRSSSRTRACPDDRRRRDALLRELYRRRLTRLRDNDQREVEKLGGPSRYTILSATPDAFSAQVVEDILVAQVRRPDRPSHERGPLHRADDVPRSRRSRRMAIGISLRSRCSSRRRSPVRRSCVLVSLFVVCMTSTANADADTVAAARVGDGGARVGRHRCRAPGSGRRGSRADDSARPLVHYVVSWSVDPTPAQTGSLDGLCAAPGSTAATPVFGFLYHLVGTDPTGAIVDDHFECVAFPNGDATQRPPVPPVPAVPTFGEAWNSAQLPAPPVTLDPADRAASPVSTPASRPTGPTTVDRSRRRSAATRSPAPRRSTTTRSASTAQAADRRARPATTRSRPRATHTIAISAIWHGIAAITGPDLPDGLPARRPRHRDDHVDAHVPRRRDPLRAAALS